MRFAASSSRPGGRTLVELMIASAMMLLLLGSCVTALRSAMQYYRRINEQSDIENSLLVSVGLIARDAAETAAEAVAWSATAPEGPALTFPLPRNMGGSLLIDHAAGNRLTFGTVVSYRVAGPEKELRRYVDPLASPASLPPHPLDDLTPPHNLSFYSVVGKEHKVLARGVVEFQLTGVDIDDYGSATTVVTDLAKAEVLRLTLKLERQLSRRYAVSMVMDLVPKN